MILRYVSVTSCMKILFLHVYCLVKQHLYLTLSYRIKSRSSISTSGKAFKGIFLHEYFFLTSRKNIDSSLVNGWTLTRYFTVSSQQELSNNTRVFLKKSKIHNKWRKIMHFKNLYEVFFFFSKNSLTLKCHNCVTISYKNVKKEYVRWKVQEL